jgi:hypothetical protein
MPDWQLSSARVTSFVRPDASIPSTLWREVLGDDPEESAFLKAVATKVDAGAFGEGKLTLQVQPIRVDWAYEALNATEARVPILGPFPASIDPLLGIMRRWGQMDGFPSAKRLALGAVLVSPVANLAAGYAELARLVDGVPTTGDVTDFQLQLNRQRDSGSGVGGLRINRLSKWSVGGFRILVMNFTGEGHSASALNYHLRLELDVNTLPDFAGYFDREQFMPVLEDLMAGAREIAERGNRF